jgi:hypothetical protein
MNLTPLIETLKRPGLLGLIGQRSEKRMRQALESYFQVLGRRVAGLNLESLAGTSKEIIRHGVEMRLHNTLRILTPLLKAAIELGIQDAMVKSNSIHHFSEAAGDNPLGDGPDDSTGMITSEEAAQYASERAAELVTGINDTTRSLSAGAIEKGLEDQLSSEQTARLIRQTFQDMTIQRSRMIATTEMADAMSEAMLRKLDRLGIEYKRWVLSPDACPICEDNAAQGAIPIDDDFDSGDDRPPAHPNCRCAVVGAREPVVQ